MAGEPSSNESLSRRAVKGGSIYFAVRLTQQFLQLGITLLLFRFLSPNDYGMMTSASLLIGLADLLAEAGVSKAIIHKKNLTSDDLAQAFTLNLVLSVALYGVIFAAADYLADYLERPEFAFFVRVLALVLLLIPLRALSGALLERDLRFGRNSIVFLVGNMIQVLLQVMLAWLGWGYWSLALGTMIGRTLEAVLGWYWTRFPMRFAWPGPETRELLVFGLHVSAGSFLWYVYSNADFAVIGAILGPVELGYYAVAFQIASLPAQKISANINQVLFAVFARMRDDPEKVADWFLRLMLLAQAASMPALVGIMLIAPDLVPWLLTDKQDPEKWLPAVVPLQLLCPMGILVVFSSSFLQTISALGRPDINTRYTALSVVLFPLGFVIAGSYAGILGVCGVWLVLYPLLQLGLVHTTRQLTHITLPRLFVRLSPVVLATAFMAGGVWAVQTFMPEDTSLTVRVLSQVAIGAVLYTVTLLVLIPVATMRRAWQMIKDVRG